MEPLTLISVITAAASVLICVLIIRRVKSRLKEMLDALEDIRTGNGNRRILSAADELTAPIAYEINEIVSSYEKKLSAFRRTDEANRQLMTSLSHDVRTPLTTLIGYLDAAHRGLVTGGEKDGKPALHAAALRAYRSGSQQAARCPLPVEYPHVSAGKSALHAAALRAYRSGSQQAARCPLPVEYPHVGAGKPALHAAALRAYRTKCPAAVIKIAAAGHSSFQAMPARNRNFHLSESDHI